jgi:hypothetical protein
MENSEAGTYSVAAAAPGSAAEPQDRAAPAADQAAGAGAILAAATRKIIYNATLSMIVENVESVGDQVAKVVKQAGGYIAETDLSGDAQSQRRATWKVRVPVEKFEDVVSEVSRLGELERSHRDSEDVTQEYYDLEARIKNKQQEEMRLLKHLADSTGKLEDILAVERELTRVRGEVEQMQGRIKYL